MLAVNRVEPRATVSVKGEGGLLYILSRICGGNEKEGVRMIQDIQQYIHDEFQWFHRHPELSFKEVETTERIRQDLQKVGYVF